MLKKYWPPLFLFLSLIYFFRETLFFGKMFVPFGLGVGDHNLSTVPILYYLSDSLKHGQLPLWDPNTLGGIPLFAGILGSYQPLNLIFLRFLPFPLALNLYVFSIFLILGFSTFYFIKSQKLSNEAALIATLSFTFASGVTARIIHIAVIGTIAYLPLLLLLTQKFFEKKNVLLLILTGVVLALQILFAHQPTFFITSIAFVGFFIFKTFTESKTKNIFTDLTALVVIYTLAFSLSAVQLVPGWPWFLTNDRSKGIAETQFKEFPFHPGELSYFIRPTPIGNPSLGNYDSPYLDPGIFWENTAYVGLLGLTFAFVALIFLYRSKRIVLFFGLLLILAVVLALGKFAPLYFVWRLPPFTFFRMPSRFLLLAMFSLSVLAAFGFEALTQRYLKKRALLALGAAIIILIDLVPFGLKYNATYDTQKWLSPPQSAQFLEKDPSFFRYYSLGGYESYYDVYRQFRGWQKTVEPYYNLREDLALNLNLIYGLNIAGSGNGISKTTRWQSFLYGNLNVDSGRKTVQPNSTALKMLRLLNVKYLISYFEIKGEDFTLRKKIDFTTSQPGFYLYELKNPFPHAFIVHQAKVVKTDDEAFKIIAREDFDPQKTVLTETAFEDLTESENSGDNRAEVIEYFPQRVVIEAQNEKPGLLILTDTEYPGWEAKVDGQVAKIYQADRLFRAVKLNPGEHQVEFVYKPKYFYIGAWISLSTLIIITLYMSITGVRSLSQKFRYQKRDSR